MKYEEELNKIMGSLRLCPSDFLAELQFRIMTERMERSQLLEQQKEVIEKDRKVVKLHIVKEE